ncbi:Metallo-dependent phosphatase [Aspergillus sclerotioniger CBS 115572]|uniref:Sphingomyelin phosphodiesterase n=1 Tax=Aspergillus sclerotioniger CBS 115572 TaxID=1450535 RepID=A0A317XA17_9EURO|nr:Metallo-dependent phosphatase [Aspergillus sclerotioniger CBS 115572]PWY93758.1 Metallo-dependent phosphatase [Aspergillus sclerotioniger CBS 115572]
MKPALLLSVLVIGSWATWTDLVWDDIRAATSCVACESLLRSLQKIARQGPSTLEAVVTEVCIRSKLFDADFCTGLAASQIPSAHYVLTQMQIPSFTAQTFCAGVLDLCPPPPPRPFNLTLPPVPSPPTTSTTTTTTTTNTLRIAHLTDTHVDLLYTPGSSTTCRKPICCRPYTPHDAPGNTTKPCPTWGHPRCDPPLRLLESMLSAVQALQPQFVLYTGDVVPHDVWSETQPSVLHSFNTTYSTLRTTFNCPIYPAIGNHDTNPVSIFPVTDTIPAHLNPQWAYDALATHWRTLLPNTTTTQFHHGAYATTLTLPTTTTPLKIISYNSNLYYRFNILTYTTPMSPDPMNQFSWLITELTSAERLAQKVYLLTHIPSTRKDTLPEYAYYLAIIFRRFQDTIVGVFCGHGHLDTFGVVYGNRTGTGGMKKEVGEVMELEAPGITPMTGPPAFRMLMVDGDDWGVLDLEVWVADISSSSSSYSSSLIDTPEEGIDESGEYAEPKWRKYYSAQEAYGRYISQSAETRGIGATFWAKLTDIMEWNRMVFMEYWARRTRGWFVTVCVGRCAEREICRLRGGCGSKVFSLSLDGGRDEDDENENVGNKGGDNGDGGDDDVGYNGGDDGDGDGGSEGEYENDGDWNWHDEEGLGALGQWLRKVQAKYPVDQ